jgi:hypothetical protein
VSPAHQTVVFHPGAHKTGTSLIQKFMTANRTLLHDKGIAILDRTELDAMIRWGQVLLSDPQLLEGAIRDRFRTSGCDLLLASHELTFGQPFVTGGHSLYPDRRPAMEALARILEPYRVQIFYSIRPQAEMLESYYLQMIHQGKYDTFAEWLARFDLDNISWKPVISDLRETFGAENVEVVDFGLIRQGQEVYIREFLTRIDPAYDFEVSYPDIKNPSISGKGLDMALAANRYLRNTPERQAMRKFLQRYFANTRYPRPQLLSPERKAEITARWGDEYAELVATSTRPGVESAR